MSTDSGREATESLCTPVRQKRFSASHGSSSSKRSLFREFLDAGQNQEVSDTESDLGIMSPLDLSDKSPSVSSEGSSPHRNHASSFASPTGSPSTLENPAWDRLKPARSGSLSPFRLLKKTSRAARYSPRRIFHLKSPLTSIPLPRIPVTPPRLETSNVDIVPETPESCRYPYSGDIMETPQKSDSPEFKLMTPLSSISKNLTASRPHRRKILGELDSSSDQKEWNRNLDEPKSPEEARLQKVHEAHTIPKARASLFTDKLMKQQNEDNQKAKTVDTKSFYGTQTRKSFSFSFVPKGGVTKKRPSAPSSKRSIKKGKIRGQINCGIGHGIKKPKPKAVKVVKKSPQDQQSQQKKRTRNDLSGDNENTDKCRPFVIDPTKRFFKNVYAPETTVPINKNMTNAKAENASEKNPPAKRVKLDATDLLVDEPEVETPEQKNDVTELLRILEDDWANDEFDTMGNMPVSVPPTQKDTKSDLSMSPSSELSNMTSVMNIQDKNATNDSGKSDGKKLFPLFSKGYRDNVVFEDSNKKRNGKRTAFKAGLSDDQYQLDLGQKRLRAMQCSECGVVYQQGDPDDENAHLNYHNSYKVLKFQGWKKERVVHTEFSGRVILVEPSDPKVYWNKVSDILEVVDRDLGLADVHLSYYRDKKIYLYIRDKMVVGILVAEEIESAHHLISEFPELNCCREESTPAKCGVNVVWTAMSYRKKRIATTLVDVLRKNFYYGYIMTIDDIAFSTPTPNGKIFAEKYTKIPNFKVYN